MAGSPEPSIGPPDPTGIDGRRVAKVEIAGHQTWVELDGDDVIEIGAHFTSERSGRKLGSASDCRFLAPIEPHNQIINLMGNFTGRTDRRGPGIFVKPISTVNHYGRDIVWPAGVPNVNMESELVVVIGKEAKAVTEQDALDYVFGYTVSNDVTSFGVIEEEGFDALSMRFKMYDTFMPLGPWIVTGIDDADTRHGCSRLNGELVQDFQLSDMDFNAAQTVSWISKVMTLRPGDVISMGTAPGFRDMAEGDIVECTIDGIGTLVNRVVRGG